MISKDIHSVHECELNSHNKIAALIEIITELKQHLRSAKLRDKGVVFVSVSEYEFLIDQLLGLVGSISGDLTNAYSTIKLQTSNKVIFELMEASQFEKIKSDLWFLVEKGMKAHRTQNKH